MRYWLMKSEPDVYGIDDLAADGTACWEGVRNYQARNFMRDDMTVGDRILFYHSNAKPPGIAGLARVAKEAYPDHYAWDPKSKYFDSKSSPDNPRWMMVDVAYRCHVKRFVSLEELRGQEVLADLPLLNKSRLSIQPLDEVHYQCICDLAKVPKKDH
jgi:predicted RNA-binding protein with PUA-like domain